MHGNPNRDQDQSGTGIVWMPEREEKMAQSKMPAGRKALAAVMAAFMACLLMMSCSTPAFAKEAPVWGMRENYGQERQTGTPASEGQEYGNEGSEDGSATENNDGGEDNGDGSGSERSDEGRSDESAGENGTTEQGFSTPGNGSLGDQIRSSTGKDFYTIHTKNNNTFYLVIDHTDSTENVYMLSLIDENDLAEFLEELQDSKQQTAAPVIIPQTKPETETTTQTGREEAQQPAGAPMQISFIWIIAAAAAGIGALYYFKVYKPGREENEADDYEGMETMGDGLPTESED